MDKLRSKLNVVLMVMWDGSTRLNLGSLDHVSVRELMESTFVVVKRDGDDSLTVYKERYDMVKHHTTITCDRMLDVAAEHQRIGKDLAARHPRLVFTDKD